MTHEIALGAALAVLFAWPAASQDTGDSPANALQKRMFYRSFVQDAPACRQSVAAVNGKAVFQGAVAGSAAATCPDAFAWTQFASAVSEGFWNWGTDHTVWPEKPWPICSGNQSYPEDQCCEPGTVPAEQPDACPVFRADYDPPSLLAITLSGNPSNDVRSHHALMGAPDMAWFYANGGPSVAATQVDFVWGTLNANCVNPALADSDQKKLLPDVPCLLDSYPSAPTVVPAQ